MPKIKKGVNVFTSPIALKEWAIDLSEACGSVLINKKPNISKIDTLVEKFVTDYNENMEKINATKEEE
tara:strand:- start:24 stop:227 length:204 start_codon:yes stop_codon:yes gene_type:complete